MYAAQLHLVGVLGISLNPLTLAKDFANAVASAVLGSVGKGASAIVRALLGFITSTSDPSFSSGWWSSSGTGLFERVTAVTGSLLALAFMCSIITAMISGDRSLLARAFIRLPVAVLQIALVVTVTGALVGASDQVAAEIAKGATTNLSKFVALDMMASITGSGIVGLVCGGLVILAALAVWAELLVRSALIYLAVLTAPLVFAAGVHPSVSGLKRRYIEGALALITSKIVVALAFATGSAMLSGLGRSPSFAAAVGALLEALVILGVAAFAPFILSRLFLGAEGIIAARDLPDDLPDRRLRSLEWPNLLAEPRQCSADSAQMAVDPLVVAPAAEIPVAGVREWVVHVRVVGEVLLRGLVHRTPQYPMARLVVARQLVAEHLIARHLAA